MIRRPPRSTLFPYTTLFRSAPGRLTMSATRRISDSHAALVIAQGMEVRRVEYLDYMTFRANQRPLFTELFGPIVGLKEEWRSAEHTSELQSRHYLVCLLLLD